MSPTQPALFNTSSDLGEDFAYISYKALWPCRQCPPADVTTISMLFAA